MHDSYGDGWNGNIFSLTDQNGNLAASCTLDTGSEGVCEFSLGGLLSNNEVLPVTAIDNADPNKEENIALNYADYISTINDLRDNQQTTEILTRDMLAYRVYKDGEFLVETDLNTFSYTDNDTEHDVIYCYTVRTVYDVGESVDSNQSCDEWILMPVTDFDVTGTNGQVELIWTAANSNDVLGYNVNRDGVYLDFTTDSFYNDVSAVHNVEYCYTVEAVYEIGNSDSSDEECGMWEILSSDEVFAVGDDGVVHVTWTDPPAGGSGGIGGECELFDYYGNEIVGFLDIEDQYNVQYNLGTLQFHSHNNRIIHIHHLYHLNHLQVDPSMLHEQHHHLQQQKPHLKTGFPTYHIPHLMNLNYQFHKLLLLYSNIQHYGQRIHHYRNYLL
jgi:hypothetical protein